MPPLSHIPPPVSDVKFLMCGGLLVVTFDRPDKHNALNGAMAKAMAERFKFVCDDRSVRAVLLRGRGAHFMCGHDTEALGGDVHEIQDAVLLKAQMFYATIREMQAMEKPIIAAVHGRVTGPGYSLMLASDLVIAARSTIFNSAFTSDGMTPDGGASYFLPRRIGLARSNEVLMLNEDMTGEQAVNIGLINRLADDDKLQDISTQWAEKLAEGATRALGGTKRLLSKALDHDLITHLPMEAAMWNSVCKTSDFREARIARRGGRPPHYTGA